MDLRSWPGTDWRRHGNRDAAASPAAAASGLGGGARAARGALGPAWHYRVGTSDLGRSCGACLPSAGSFIGLHVSSVYSDLSGTCTLTCAWHPPRGTAHGSAPSVALRLAGTSPWTSGPGQRHATLASRRAWPARRGGASRLMPRGARRAGVRTLRVATAAARRGPPWPGRHAYRSPPIRWGGPGLADHGPGHRCGGGGLLLFGASSCWLSPRKGCTSWQRPTLTSRLASRGLRDDSASS